MADIKGWYDRDPKLGEMMEILSNMPEKELSQISRYLFEIVNMHWEKKKEKESFLSIGKEKLSSYYKAHQKKRWYDKNPNMCRTVNIMSLLSSQELGEIAGGYLYAIREAGLYKSFCSKKQELQEKEII